MNNSIFATAATSDVLGTCPTVEAAVVRRTVAPASVMVKGTGLPFGTRPSVLEHQRIRPSMAVPGALLGAFGVVGVMGPDEVPAAGIRITAVVDQGDPPRRTPSRC